MQPRNKTHEIRYKLLPKKKIPPKTRCLKVLKCLIANANPQTKLQRQNTANSTQNVKRPAGFTIETSMNESSGGRITSQSESLRFRSVTACGGTGSLGFMRVAATITFCY